LISQINLLLEQATAAFQQGNYPAAEAMLKSVIRVDKNNFPALCILGLIKALKAEYQEAVELLQKAEKINPKDLGVQVNLAKIFMDKGDPDQALKHYLNVSRTNPNDLQILIQIAICNGLMDQNEHALRALEKVLKIDPNIPDAWYYSAIGLGKLNRDTEALLAYEKTLALDPNHISAWIGMGVTLIKKEKLENAINCFDRALKINPQDILSYYNKGIIYGKLNRPKSALSCYEKCLELNPQFLNALFNKGAILAGLKDYSSASLCFENLLEMNPDHEYLLGNLIHSRMQLASWDGMDILLERLIKSVREDKKVTSPFFALSAFDDPDLHKKVAVSWIENWFPEAPYTKSAHTQKKEKIKIGYFSPDFRAHPVSYLTAELFELHDRNEFEILAFSLMPTDEEDNLNKRLLEGFDRFINVDTSSGYEIAAMAREIGIDIAIDLGGHTENSKTTIFANRAAPIQVAYLGYPGTIGANYIDYVISDGVVTPQDAIDSFTEKIIFMPNCFQVSDRKRKMSEKIISKKDFGLPDIGFIYCCFNNIYKITPEVFDSWMRILNNVDGSVLWLYAPNLTAAENFKAYAIRRSIDPARLIFGGMLPHPDYLARYKLADIFLDTFPYNAGTTANDALWTGLPLITRIGSSMASRMAASMLTTLEMPELIAESLEAYEAIAIEFGKNPESLRQIKEKLHEKVLSSPLFDTPLFTSNLERAFKQIHARHHLGLPPDHIRLI